MLFFTERFCSWWTQRIWVRNRRCFPQASAKKSPNVDECRTQQMIRHVHVSARFFVKKSRKLENSSSISTLNPLFTIFGILLWSPLRLEHAAGAIAKMVNPFFFPLTWHKPLENRPHLPLQQSLFLFTPCPCVYLDL